MTKKVDYEGLIHQAYRALNNLPCACRYMWQTGPYNPSAHDTLEGRVRTYQCARCVWIESYRSEFPE